jgi:hypothetical protein
VPNWLLQKFRDFFDTHDADRLPSRQATDHAIELMVGTEPPHMRTCDISLALDNILVLPYQEERLGSAIKRIYRTVCARRFSLCKEPIQTAQRASLKEPFRTLAEKPYPNSIPLPKAN